MNYTDETKEFHEVDSVYIGTKDLVYSKNSLDTVIELSKFNEIILDGEKIYQDKDFVMKSLMPQLEELKRELHE